MKINTDPIYTITTIRGPSFDKIRCVGFYHELEIAIEAVEENAMDMNECRYYHYALVEKVGPGFYNLQYLGTDDHETWFRWNNEQEKYLKCEKPNHYKNTVCFGIG